ncbi:hypothetical protein H072_4684 [Dactylellina haptotyla CBS 200.50]|uniref:Uncharacterized protein n=1 Tax=Dactylellina haptotyla (strain CBS 200.50) TaxID=1284197 RepID=S8AEU5_DACHA|nr:hypothetical protein H072_4684 [Dactylellina haptotyla CBS 200.50]
MSVASRLSKAIADSSVLVCSPGVKFRLQIPVPKQEELKRLVLERDLATKNGKKQIALVSSGAVVLQAYLDQRVARLCSEHKVGARTTKKAVGRFQTRAQAAAWYGIIEVDESLGFAVNPSVDTSLDRADILYLLWGASTSDPLLRDTLADTFDKILSLILEGTPQVAIEQTAAAASLEDQEGLAWRVESVALRG